LAFFPATCFLMEAKCCAANFFSKSCPVRTRRNSSIGRRRNPVEVYQYRDQKRTSALVKEAAIGEQPHRVLFGCSGSPPVALVLKSSKIDEDCSRSHSFPTGPMGLLHGFAHSPTFLWCILLVVSAHKIRNKSISTGSKSGSIRRNLSTTTSKAFNNATQTTKSVSH